MHEEIMPKIVEMIRQCQFYKIAVSCLNRLSGKEHFQYLLLFQTDYKDGC